MAPLPEAAEVSPDLIRRRRKVEQKRPEQDRRDELEYIENGPHYAGSDTLKPANSRFCWLRWPSTRREWWGSSQLER